MGREKEAEHWVERKKEREFGFSLASAQGVKHMAVASEGVMSLRLLGRV